MGRTQGILGRLFSPHLGDDLTAADTTAAGAAAGDVAGAAGGALGFPGAGLLASQAGTQEGDVAAAGETGVAPQYSAGGGGSSWLPGFGSGLAQGFVTSLNQIISPVRTTAPTSIFGALGTTPFLIGGGILLILLLAKKNRSAPAPAVVSPA